MKQIELAEFYDHEYILKQMKNEFQLKFMCEKTYSDMKCFLQTILQEYTKKQIFHSYENIFVHHNEATNWVAITCKINLY